jgi:hypothetical protein
MSRGLHANRNAAAMLALLRHGPQTGVDLLRAGIYSPGLTAQVLTRHGYVVRGDHKPGDQLGTTYRLETVQEAMF